MGYYEAGGLFVRLKATTFGGRDWAVGKPNATVTKVIARTEKRPSKLETGLKVAGGVVAVAGVVGAAAIAASAEQRASNSEQQLQVAQDELADSRELTGDFATALVQERELSSYLIGQQQAPAPAPVNITTYENCAIAVSTTGGAVRARAPASDR